MRTLRFGILVALSGALAVGCDDGRGGDDAGPVGTDSGLRLMDSGPGRDSGPGTDSGPSTGTDSGPSTGSCGPTGGACTVSDVSSCGSGQGCVLVGSSDTMWEAMCIPSGVLGQGDSCNPTMPNQCQEGFQCNGPAGAETCRRICCGNTDCAAGVLCQQIAGADGAGFCRPSDGCDVTDADSCGTGEGCYPLGSEGDTQCLSAGTAGEGETCAALNACQASFGCAGSPGVCRAYCNPTSPDCATGFMCAGLTPGEGQPPIPGIGVCVPETSGG